MCICHLQKKLLCTLIFCATTPKGDKQNFVAEITMNVLKRYGYTFSSIGLWQTAGLVRVHTKPKSLSHSNQTKFQGVYGQSSFPWTAESKSFYAMLLVFFPAMWMNAENEWEARNRAKWMPKAQFSWRIGAPLYAWPHSKLDHAKFNTLIMHEICGLAHSLQILPWPMTPVVCAVCSRFWLLLKNNNFCTQ